MVPDARLICGDCVDVLSTLAEGSVDAVVTDPPYGLEFMGEAWDKLWDNRGGQTRFKHGDVGSLRNRPVYKAGVEAQTYHRRWASAALHVLKPGGYMLAFGGTRTYHRLACAVEDAGFEIRDCLMWLYSSGFPKHAACLKPAYEPVLLCRKVGIRSAPLEIDACRVGPQRPLGTGKSREGEASKDRRYTKNGGTDFAAKPGARGGDHRGRYPANVVHDGSDDVRMTVGRTAARVFYCAKASRTDRGRGNTHPTVKPSALMTWLVKLILRPGDVCLDPFLGSGSTGVAAAQCGVRFVGVERDKRWVDVAARRIRQANVGMGLMKKADFSLTVE